MNTNSKKNVQNKQNKQKSDKTVYFFKTSKYDTFFPEWLCITLQNSLAN